MATYCVKNRSGKFVSVSYDDYNRDTGDKCASRTATITIGDECTNPPITDCTHLEAQKRYKCENGACVEAADGTYTEPTCNNECSGGGASGTIKWGCVSGECITGDTSDPNFKYTNKATCEAGEASCGSTPPPTPPTPPRTSSYRNCSGPTYKKWCKDPGATPGNPNENGLIYKVQSCLGSRLRLDSYFGPKTLKALQDAGYGSSFTEDDVDEICATTNTGQSTGSGTNNENIPTTTVGTEKYWETLIDNEQIYRDGLIYKLKSGEYVYIIKTDVNNPDIKYPLDSLSGENPDDYDYLVLYPVQPGDTKGKFNILAYFITPNGEKKVRQEKNRSWKWEPEQAYEYFDLAETIKRKLRNILNEQKIYGRGKKQDSSVGVNTSGSNMTFYGQNNSSASNNQSGSQGSNQSSSTPAKLDPEKVSAIMTPLKEEALDVLENWKDYNDNLRIGSAGPMRIGGKKQLGEAIDDSINEIESIDPKDFCSDETLEKLNTQKTYLEAQEKSYSNVLTDQDKEYISELKTIMNNLLSNCKKLKAKITQSSSQGTSQGTDQGTSQGTNQGTTTSDSNLYEIFGFVDNTGKPFTKSKVEARVKSITRKGGERNYGTLQDAINNSDARSYYFAEYNELINDAGLGEEFILKFPDNFDDMDLAGQEIDDDNESALFPLEDEMLGSDFVKKTFGNFLGTKGTAEIYVAKGQGARMSSSRVKCGAANPRKFLIDYLYNGLVAQKAKSKDRDERKKEREKEQEKITEQKRILCSCYSAGAFNKFKPITKKELGSMGKGYRPFKLLDRRLNFKEITNLIKGNKVNGQELDSKYVDSNFPMSCTAVNESTRLKSNINSLLTEAVVTKRKERTREVIVEDLLKIIKGF